MKSSKSSNEEAEGIFLEDVGVDFCLPNRGLLADSGEELEYPDTAE